MNYSVIKNFDTANGVGIRVSIFFCGCKFHCKNCHNEEIWDFNSGKPFDNAAVEYVLSLASNSNIDGISILGGEPLQQNLVELKEFLSLFKEKFPTKNVWMWTGYCLSEIRDNEDILNVLEYVDYLVDGRFVISKKDIKLNFRGSSNQTIWEIVKTDEGKVEFKISNLN